MAAVHLGHQSTSRQEVVEHSEFHCFWFLKVQNISVVVLVWINYRFDPLQPEGIRLKWPPARTHGHAMVIRWKRTLPLTDWQQEQCQKRGRNREECIKRWERENFCWEKFPFMVEPWALQIVYI